MNTKTKTAGKMIRLYSETSLRQFTLIAEEKLPAGVMMFTLRDGDGHETLCAAPVAAFNTLPGPSMAVESHQMLARR